MAVAVRSRSEPGSRRRRSSAAGLQGQRIISHAVLILAAAVALYPVLWLVFVSFKSKEQYLANKLFLSWPLHLQPFVGALRGGRFFLWLMNSSILTSGSVIICTVIAFLAAFALAKMRFGGQRVILNAVISLMAVPIVVLIVPLFILYTRLRLMSTYHGLIIMYAAVCLPFSVYLLTNFFKTVPDEIMEAGVIDGCPPLEVLTRVVIPLSGPPIVTLIVVNAVWVWNELLLALVFLPKDHLRTLMVGITVFKSRFNLDINVTMAGLLLTTLPIVVLYIIFQKFFIRGLTEGALKG
jgi:ABC-type glycerol-3-phosphate transport system permease component